MIPQDGAIDFTPDALAPDPDELATMTDRELLIRIAYDTALTRATIEEAYDLILSVKEQVGPLVDSLASSPMLKMLLPKGK